MPAIEPRTRTRFLRRDSQNASADDVLSEILPAGPHESEEGYYLVSVAGCSSIEIVTAPGQAGESGTAYLAVPPWWRDASSSIAQAKARLTQRRLAGWSAEQTHLTATIERIERADISLSLRRPIRVPWIFEDGLWVLEYPSLGIVAYGESQEEASQDFAEDFAFLWTEIAQQPDSNLTQDARVLKRLLLALVLSR